MKIGEFSKASGLSKDTIRYYEKIGILQPTKQQNQRFYTTAHLEIANTIIKLKQVGFSLQEIRDLQELAEEMDHQRYLTAEELNKVNRMKELFQHKYQEMLEQEETIKHTKKILTRAEKKLAWLLEKNVWKN